MNLLFICEGNTCRGPMAATYFKHLIAQNKIQECEAISAGLSVEVDEENPVKASDNAQACVKIMGLSLEDHLAQQVHINMVVEADNILCMSQAIQDEFLSVFPEAAEKTSKLMTMLKQDTDIDDPAGLDSEAYQSCFLSMMPALVETADRILEYQQS